MHSPVRLALALLLLILPSLLVFAHGGGLDRYGCHTDQTTGLKHCHSGEEQESQDSGVPTRFQSYGDMRSWQPTKELLIASLTGELKSCTGVPGEDLLRTTANLLQALEYDVSTEGRVDPALLNRAIRRFQWKAGITIDGEISGSLLVELSQALVRGHESPPLKAQP